MNSEQKQELVAYINQKYDDTKINVISSASQNQEDSNESIIEKEVVLEKKSIILLEYTINKLNGYKKDIEIYLVDLANQVARLPNEDIKLVLSNVDELIKYVSKRDENDVLITDFNLLDVIKSQVNKIEEDYHQDHLKTLLNNSIVSMRNAENFIFQESNSFEEVVQNDFKIVWKKLDFSKKIQLSETLLANSKGFKNQFMRIIGKIKKTAFKFKDRCFQSSDDIRIDNDFYEKVYEDFKKQGEGFKTENEQAIRQVASDIIYTNVHIPWDKYLEKELSELSRRRQHPSRQNDSGHERRITALMTKFSNMLREHNIFRYLDAEVDIVEARISAQRDFFQDMQKKLVEFDNKVCGGGAIQPIDLSNMGISVSYNETDKKLTIKLNKDYTNINNLSKGDSLNISGFLKEELQFLNDKTFLFNEYFNDTQTLSLISRDQLTNSVTDITENFTDTVLIKLGDVSTIQDFQTAVKNNSVGPRHKAFNLNDYDLAEFSENIESSENFIQTLFISIKLIKHNIRFQYYNDFVKDIEKLFKIYDFCMKNKHTSFQESFMPLSERQSKLEQIMKEILNYHLIVKYYVENRDHYNKMLKNIKKQFTENNINSDLQDEKNIEVLTDLCIDQIYNDESNITSSQVVRKNILVNLKNIRKKINNVNDSIKDTEPKVYLHEHIKRGQITKEDIETYKKINNDESWFYNFKIINDNYRGIEIDKLEEFELEDIFQVKTSQNKINNYENYIKILDACITKLEKFSSLFEIKFESDCKEWSYNQTENTILYSLDKHDNNYCIRGEDMKAFDQGGGDPSGKPVIKDIELKESIKFALQIENEKQIDILEIRDNLRNDLEKTYNLDDTIFYSTFNNVAQDFFTEEKNEKTTIDALIDNKSYDKVELIKVGLIGIKCEVNRIPENGQKFNFDLFNWIDKDISVSGRIINEFMLRSMIMNSDKALKYIDQEKIEACINAFTQKKSEIFSYLFKKPIEEITADEDEDLHNWLNVSKEKPICIIPISVGIFYEDLDYPLEKINYTINDFNFTQKKFINKSFDINYLFPNKYVFKIYKETTNDSIEISNESSDLLVNYFRNDGILSDDKFQISNYSFVPSYKSIKYGNELFVIKSQPIRLNILGKSTQMLLAKSIGKDYFTEGKIKTAYSLQNCHPDDRISSDPEKLYSELNL